MGDTLRARRSIRGKIDRLVFVSVGLALLVAGALNVWNEAGRYLALKRETLLATALVFGSAVSKGVAAKDPAAVMEGIRAIARIPGLVRAEVEGRNGALLAEIGNAVRLKGDLRLDEAAGASALDLLRSRTLELAVPVIDGGERVGRLVLISESGDLIEQFAGALTAAAVGSAAALCLGLFLSHRLQRAITRPLVSLAAAMADVERTNRFVPVAAEASDDETGILASRFNSMIGEIRRATDEILARESEIIERLSRAGELRDDQTGLHVVRVARVSRIIAGRLGLDPAYTDDLCRASPMHDVGKISIPDAILHKPGRLDPDERREMEKHALRGYQILAGSNAALVRLAAEIALSHHERWDGKGYPNGRSGSEIPLSGRITAVADVCDALLSVRPYKQPWSLAAVKAHLLENSGSHFDPTCVEALIARWPELEAIYAQPSDPEALAA